MSRLVGGTTNRNPAIAGRNGVDTPGERLQRGAESEEDQEKEQREIILTKVVMASLSVIPGGRKGVVPYRPFRAV